MCDHHDILGCILFKSHSKTSLHIPEQKVSCRSGIKLVNLTYLPNKYRKISSKYICDSKRVKSSCYLSRPDIGYSLSVHLLHFSQNCPLFYEFVLCPLKGLIFPIFQKKYLVNLAILDLSQSLNHSHPPCLKIPDALFLSTSKSKLSKIFDQHFTAALFSNSNLSAIKYLKICTTV